MKCFRTFLKRIVGTFQDMACVINATVSKTVFEADLWNVTEIVFLNVTRNAPKINVSKTIFKTHLWIPFC